MLWDRNYHFDLPRPILRLLDILEAGGFEAVVVGGCVRDFLLGRIPKDCDLATSATTQELAPLLKAHKIPTIPLGLAFGTLGALFGKKVFEITTYRKESGYTDHRHPQVCFNATLETDLKRRDFTINALACHPKKGLLDLHGGVKDLRLKRLRFVGVASARVSEDALRILRALRFASVLGFKLEPVSAQAVLEHAPLLKHISKERIFAELCKILMGANAGTVCATYTKVLECALNAPLKPHILKRLSQMPLNLTTRFLALLTACSTPLETLAQLKPPKKLFKNIEKLLPYTRQSPPTSKIWLKTQMQSLSLSQVRAWLGWLKAYEPSKWAILRAHFKEIGAQREVYSLGFLAIDGRSLRGVGLKKAEIGAGLLACLNEVVQERLENRPRVLLDFAKGWAKNLREHALK
ncbi:[cytidine(C)-cytidine(C)-adenosine (A)]-adding enzyme [Helicobacter heilmannii]|uniref:tRNA nucleotidyltransferase n=1 Tax=Helicobacter heilmannii TaxID=35817 RepID=A0A0K2Y432_HELHE|nr:[cytidine(C)-cytidine(C)-adenosine (A)]-adding enzyme [Helicobacter heilmannii]CCM11732.1 tRNA nucleotidyltransferase [Helicobacter heilmannii ASB1.4]CRI33871.1 tRNA nucleotidyltransferase [Helicobacter heilmannii]